VSAGWRQAALVTGLSAAALELVVILFGDDPLFAAVMIWPVPLAGALAFAIAVREGASRWWLAAIPLLVLPLLPYGLLWSACKFGSDCL
jgi:hypothetical protein